MGQQHHRLYMIRKGEHIDGGDAADGVAALCDEAEITGEGFGVAGDIDYPPGVEPEERVYEFTAASGAGRVGEYHIRALALVGHRLHEFARVRAVKTDVFHIVALRV